MSHKRSNSCVIGIHIHNISRYTTRSVHCKKDRWRLQYFRYCMYGVPLKGDQLARGKDARRLVLNRKGDLPGQEVQMLLARFVVMARYRIINTKKS